MLKRYVYARHESILFLLRNWCRRQEQQQQRDIDTDIQVNEFMQWARNTAALSAALFGAAFFRDFEQTFACFEALLGSPSSFQALLSVRLAQFGGAIRLLGSDEQYTRFYSKSQDVVRGCVAFAERAHGTDEFSIETLVRLADDSKDRRSAPRFVLHTPAESATKWFVVGLRRATHCVVMARLVTARNVDLGVHAFCVALDSRGVARGDCGARSSFDGVDAGWLRFDSVQLPLDSMLSRHAQIAVSGGGGEALYRSDVDERSSDAARLRVERFRLLRRALAPTKLGSVVQTGAALKFGLLVALRHAYRRAQFAPSRGGAPSGASLPLIEYTAVRRRLLVPLAHAYALHFAGRWTARVLQRRADAQLAPPSDRYLTAWLGALKASSSVASVDALRGCVASCGAQGHLAANCVGSLLGDAVALANWDGDNELLLQQLGAELLREHTLREARASTSLRTRVARRFERARTSLSLLLDEQEMAADSESALLGSAYQRQLFRYREQRQLLRVAAKLAGVRSGGQRFFDAWNQVSADVVALATAHTERIIFERFVDAVRRCDTQSSSSSSPLQSTLKRLCDVYALDRLDEHRAFFLEYALFDKRTCSLLRKTSASLHAALVPQALELIDAIAFEQRIDHLPIAKL
jgi:acyl-CoA oxidase